MKVLQTCVLCAAWTLTVPRAFAIVDHQYVPATTNQYANVGAANIVDWAQTFTVGVTGTLTGVDIWVDRHMEVMQPLLFDIRRTDSGVPTEPDSGPNILASLAIPADRFSISPGTMGPPPAELPRFDLASESFSVVAGELLAIVLRSDAPGAEAGRTYNWHGNSPGTYSLGTAYVRTDSTWREEDGDQVFRAYITPIPEPVAAWLSVAAFIGMQCMSHRIRRL